MKKAIQWSTWLRINVAGVYKEQQSTRLQVNWMWSRFILRVLRRGLSAAEGCHSSTYYGEKDSLSLIEVVLSSRAKTFIVFLLIKAYSCNSWQCFIVHAHLPSAKTLVFAEGATKWIVWAIPVLSFMLLSMIAELQVWGSSSISHKWRPPLSYLHYVFKTLCQQKTFWKWECAPHPGFPLAHKLYGHCWQSVWKSVETRNVIYSSNVFLKF